MASSQSPVRVLPKLLSRLNEARARTDALFRLLPPNSFYDRPIPERHRLIFYLGHLEAFDWNLLAGRFDCAPCEPEFNKLFAFGIDPVGGGLPIDLPGDWPNIARVEKYNRGARETLDEKLEDASVFESNDEGTANTLLLNVAIEHRLMHAETITYLLHSLPIERKTPQPPPAADPRPTPAQRRVAIPEGTATLGQSRSRGSFGWDNEFEEQQVFVPEFTIDAFPVTNGQFLKFVQAGGYQHSIYWTPEAWEWKRQRRLEHPHFWQSRSSSPASDPDTQWEYRAMFATIPLPHSWPVYVSHAEALAFARWSGKRLATEAEWHRAAYGTLHGNERPYPWGDSSPNSTHGNFHHLRWDPSPVDAHPGGTSAFGVQDLLGNGWEWTSTLFGPMRGFEPFPFYRGYSADFFDGKHYVMKGGSPRTDACMMRRSFRNWFQPHYPYVYAKFRCVEN